MSAARRSPFCRRRLVEERFDLLIWRKAYFDPPMQKLLAFCGSEPFRQRAKAMGGYDVNNFGAVHFNGR
jgi:hypothetical protein